MACDKKNFIPRLSRACRRFSADRDGVAAVEFAIIAVPFITLVFAIIEISVIFFVSSALDNGALEASRDIRTGELQVAGANPAAFTTTVCQGMGGLVNCDDLIVDVRRFADFGSTNTLPFAQNDEGEIDLSDLAFDAGGPNDVIVVSVGVNWRVVTPFLAPFLANNGDDRVFLLSTLSFRNEPF